MANCFDCKYAYVEDIWMQWDCKKGRKVNCDAEGFLVDKEIDCQFFEKDTDGGESYD